MDRPAEAKGLRARLLLGVVCVIVAAASFAVVSWSVSWWMGGATPGPPGSGSVVASPPMEADSALSGSDAASGRGLPASSPSDGSADADAFWADAARAADAREQAVRDAITAVADAADAPLDRKLELYRESLRQALDDTPREYVLGLRAMLTEVFLRMESVQQELAASSPAARSRELAFVRREMGYSDAEIARMATVDARREARWRNGLAYMAERRRVAATFEGEVLETELQALRERYFAHEAKTIALEERDGFFRYERPRVYGRN